MNREQSSVLQAKGKVIQEVIFSKSNEKVLIALGDTEFAVLSAQRCLGDEVEIEHEAEFYWREYKTEDLAKLFDANAMAAFAEEDARREAERKKRAEEWEREEFERLRAKFGD